MKSIKIPQIFKKSSGVKKTDGFADFFLHASDKKKKKVFKEAARLANEEQRAVVKKVKALQR